MSAKPFLIYCTGLYIIRPGGIQGQQGHTWPRLDIPVSNTKTRTCVFLMANTGKLQDLSLLHWPGMGSIWDLSPLQGRGQYYTKTWSQVPVLPQAYLRQNHWGGAYNKSFPCTDIKNIMFSQYQLLEDSLPLMMQPVILDAPS